MQHGTNFHKSRREQAEHLLRKEATGPSTTMDQERYYVARRGQMSEVKEFTSQGSQTRKIVVLSSPPTAAAAKLDTAQSINWN